MAEEETANRSMPARGGLHWRHVLFAAASAATAALALATAGGTLLGRLTYLELLTHFRLQYALGLTLCAAALAVARSRLVLAVALSGAAINWAYVAPYMPLGQAEARAAGGAPLRVMLLNVYHPNEDVEAVLAAIREEDPDVLVLQEVTGAWWKRLEPLVADYPHLKAIPAPSGSGIALLSRLPLERAEPVNFTGVSQPSIFAVVRAGPISVSVLAIHPQKPTRSAAFAGRNLQYAKAAELLHSISGPKVLVGDFNTTPWSPYFEDLVRDSGLRDPREGAGLMPTWPLTLPAPLRIPIDHVLVSEEVSVERLATRDGTGSDHCAVIADLRIAPSVE